MTDFGWPEEREGLERASSRWWLFLLLGAVSAVLGMLLIIDLFTAVRTLALLVAFGLIVTGLGELVSAGRYRSTLGMAAGVVLVLAGVLAALWPGITLWALAVVAGIGLVISGAARITGALALRVEGWGWLFVGGVLSVIVGFLAIAWPDATALVLGLLLGLRMLFFGIAEIAFGRALHDLRGSPPQ
ncbi:MAG: HdeD family acid-resistance protein [Acidimicrobiales bacterium]